MSGPVRKPDEMLPADAASGAGRTPADRPAVCPSEFWTCVHSSLTPLSYLHSPTGRQVAVVPDASDARSMRDLLNCGLDARRNAAFSVESAREHVRNALEMLTNCGDDKYLIGNERRVVYDAGDIEAVKARLEKALGRP